MIIMTKSFLTFMHFVWFLIFISSMYKIILKVLYNYLFKYIFKLKEITANVLDENDVCLLCFL